MATLTAADSVTLANRLRPVLLHINRHLRREVHKLGVSAGQISVLSAVCDKPGIGIADLAAREGTSAPSISGHVDRLEAAGLLERRREESGDRRRIGLHVTTEGARVLRDVRSRRTAWLASRLEALPPAERRRVADAVEALGALVAS
ncbi:MAG: MarR family transcriptional regulator [Candidatus Dormibacteraeota bacterium]|nr:MarR family transcriptional regulator [Candidatus Dormibacteraeota bacterium]MBV9524552.1 MarR family transcriptional regulator [Candidatus Dormibacteraeota bacterium]